jgi:sugar lactone lactonase YvrE
MIARNFKLSAVFGIFTLIATAFGSVSFAGPPPNAEDEVFVVASFDAPHWPEGLAIDKKGNIYVTQGSAFFWVPSDGWIEKISPDGAEIDQLAFFKDELGPAGIVVNARGDVFYAKPNLDDHDLNGVYQLYDDGSTVRLLGTENIMLANGLAFGKHGDLFVSDSFMGAIWRVPVDASGPAQIWSSDESLFGLSCGNPGANGVAIWKDSVYVANTAKGSLVRIPILKDGSAGQAEVVAGDNDCGGELFGMDGIALDVHGMVYALLVLQDKLVRIDPSDGSFVELLTGADGLHNPASIAFGTGKGDRKSVFIANYALFPPGPDSLGPAVLKYDVGVEGLPLP